MNNEKKLNKMGVVESNNGACACVCVCVWVLMRASGCCVCVHACMCLGTKIALSVCTIQNSHLS